MPQSTMRSISFQLTQPQIAARTKTVTRRVGWKKLQAGQLLRGVEKCMGIPRGEKQKRLCVIRVVSVRREPLDAIDQADCDAEGFPELTPAGFVAMFCRAMRCDASQIVTRIEFDYVTDEQPQLF